MPIERICKYCGGNKHLSTACFKKPRKPIKIVKRINRRGTQYAYWQKAKKLWLEENPSKDGLYTCHYCRQTLAVERGNYPIFTLDHIKARSSNPKLRYEQTNLVPCCWEDNVKKGSMAYPTFIKVYYPDRLKDKDVQENISKYFPAGI